MCTRDGKAEAAVQTLEWEDDEAENFIRECWKISELNARQGTGSIAAQTTLLISGPVSAFKKLERTTPIRWYLQQ